MAMADRQPTRTSPSSRLISLPSLQSYASGQSMSGMRGDNYASAPGGLSQQLSVSPTLERRAQDRGFPVLSNSTSDPTYVGAEPRGQASIRFRRLPRNFDISILRNILAFSDPKDCYLIAAEDGYSDAVATFGSMTQALDAQQRLNGKALPENGAKMVVDVVKDDDSMVSRRNTIDGTNARLQSTSASSSASSMTTSNNNNLLGRHGTRFSSSFAGMQDSSPPLRSPGATNAHLHTIFSPTSPVANGNSGNSLRHDNLGDDDETIQLLSETHPSSSNGRYNTDQEISNSLRALKIQPVMYNGHGNAPISSPPSSARQYSAATPSGMSSSGSMGNIPVNNNWTFTRPRQSMPPANPADQNPPCNTLYVGNLPPNTCEDELKALFSRQRGYKRLCFRTKHNGPMCFVEFDDINYAAQSLDNLYGTMLTNSVKGGIRLSFSKNPLGVRQGAMSGPNSPMSGHTISSGSSSGAGAPFATANGPPPGLPAPAMRGGQGSFGNNSSNAAPSRSFTNGVVSPSNTFTSAVYPQANHGGFNNISRNGSFVGANNNRTVFGHYSASTNGSYNHMTNGA